MSLIDDFDTGVLGDWMAQHVSGCGVIDRITKFDTGQSNPTYLVQSGEQRFVLRTKPPGKLLRSAHMVEREYRVMRALENSAVPVPKMLAIAPDDASPIGRGFFVMAFLDGRIFWDPALPELTKAARVSVYDAMNDTLAKLHSVDVDDVGLSDFGKPGNYFARQIDRWGSQYLASVEAPSAEMLAIMDWLGANLVDDDGQVALVHGDFRLDNMMFDSAGPRVIGLLDWELSTLGHPLADLAYQCSQWRLSHDGAMRGMGGLDRAALGLPDEASYVVDYCARRGIQGIDNWSFYLVFSMFRMVAILQGVVRRAEDGNASNPDSGRRYASVIPEFSSLAMDVVEGG